MQCLKLPKLRLLVIRAPRIDEGLGSEVFENALRGLIDTENLRMTHGNLFLTIVAYTTKHRICSFDLS